MTTKNNNNNNENAAHQKEMYIMPMTKPKES
jgi:hypothetical protein